MAYGSEGTQIVSLQGESQLLRDTGFVAVSPDGQRLAVWGTGYGDTVAGVRLYSPVLEPEGEMTSKPIDVLLWGPDLQGLFCVADGTLFYATDDGEPMEVEAGVQAFLHLGTGWVSPEQGA